jgi:hypothetical protein
MLTRSCLSAFVAVSPPKPEPMATTRSSQPHSCAVSGIAVTVMATSSSSRGSYVHHECAGHEVGMPH